jgi:hypothetical protein
MKHPDVTNQSLRRCHQLTDALAIHDGTILAAINLELSHRHAEREMLVAASGARFPAHRCPARSLSPQPQ